MLSKNQHLTVHVSEQGKHGQGIAFVDNLPIHIPNTLPQDLVEIKLIKLEKSRIFAKLVRILTPSQNRVHPSCNVAHLCGGCQLQHQHIDAQLQFKSQQLQQTLSQHITLNTSRILPIVPSISYTGFRNKMQFAFGLVKTSLVIGLYASRSHRIVDSHSCSIMPRAMHQVLESIKAWHAKHHVSIFDEATQTGCLRYLSLRYAFATQELMAIVTCGQHNTKLTSLTNWLKHDALVDSLYYSTQDDPKNDQVLGSSLQLAFGASRIKDNIAGITCSISPKSFVQANVKSTQTLYTTFQHILNWDKKSPLIDLYCGTGILSLMMAKDSEASTQIIGIDSNPDAIQDANQNAKSNQLEVSFYCQTAESFLQNHPLTNATVILDPPRQGCHPTVIDAICKAKPNKVGIISCNPATLGRDLALFLNQGFCIKAIQAVDMFCHSFHLEVCVCLERH